MDMDATYFFVGIKGTGMSSLALILHDKGCKVMGSDIDKYTLLNVDLNKQESKFYLSMLTILNQE